jgi:small GTP-binding protein
MGVVLNCLSLLTLFFLCIVVVRIDFKVRNVTIDGKHFKVQVWDTAGQERFRSITQAFYRRVAGIMLVYDVTDMESFKGLRHWIRSINTYAKENVDVVLVGNKCDLVEARQVPTNQGIALADEFHIPLFECSAKTSVNVEEAFMSLIRAIKKRLFDAPSVTGSDPSSFTITTTTTNNNNNNNNNNDLGQSSRSLADKSSPSTPNTCRC